ncbi:MAG: ribonuclease III, partial [Pseudomonadota bacterium]
FKDRDNLTRALTHRSALSAHEDHNAASYQRLEFVGDRVLALVISEMLYEAFPDAEEGELARRLTGLVRNETCAAVAIACHMPEFIKLGEGEQRAGGRKKEAIIGDVCEAVLAAIYFDGGLEAARGFVERNWRHLMESWSKPLRDPKTALQEWAHSKKLQSPTYLEVSRTGPDHALSFVMEVSVDGLEGAAGKGKSKREAEQKAASTFLVREGVWDKDEYE